jgi:hypothetical protein
MALDNEFREILESVKETMTVIIPEYIEDVRQRIALLNASLESADSNDATVAAYREDINEVHAKMEAIYALTGSSQYVPDEAAEAEGFEAESEDFEEATEAPVLETSHHF